MSWQSELSSALKKTEDLCQFFNLDEANISENYSSFIPLNFAQKIKDNGRDSALWKQFIPSIIEDSNHGLYDPIGDQNFQKGNGVIHRYKNRLLFTPTTVCPISCRYCFRKNELESNDEIFKQNTNALVSYLQNHCEVNEVILTGGDPLILSNQKLDSLMGKLSKTHIQYLRIHTRTPIILPSRVDDEFINTLKKYQQKFNRLTLVIHTNHSSEIDQDVTNALLKIASTQVLCLTQSVLLKGVNDSVSDLKDLFEKIISTRFKPYYLHHPDKVKGGMHFYLSLEKGREIYGKLQNSLPGWAIPKYVVDLPGGGGKQQAFNPEQKEFSGYFLDCHGQKAPY